MLLHDQWSQTFLWGKVESGCFGSTVHEEILLPGDLGNRGTD